MPNTHNISRVEDCPIISLAQHHHDNGNLSVVENMEDVPFDIKRVYYLYDIPGGEERGGLSHKECFEFIFAASGSFDIEIFDGINKKKISLNRSYQGLLVIPGIWRELKNFSSGSVCLVIASQHYNEEDYVRNYDEFMDLTANKR